MKYIIGLGNPIKENYSGTRHNVGSDFLLAKYGEDEFDFDKYSNALKTNDGEIEYLIPQTFMNRSGESLPADEAFDRDNLLVIHDDVDLPFGTVKFDFDSGTGGHNGLRSIVERIGNNNYSRIKIGVSPMDDEGNIRKPEGEGKVADFVLKPFSSREKEELEKNIFPKVEKILDMWADSGAEETRNKYGNI